ncbi:MAG: hypothetical protein ABIR32_11710, partial [Ilumatobacteraceae bacterium]
MNSPNSGSGAIAEAISKRTSAIDGGCCSRCVCAGADASLSTLRWTSPHRSAWFSEARKMAWIWRIVAGARPRLRRFAYKASISSVDSLESLIPPSTGTISRWTYWR